MVELQLPKLVTGVRFPSPAPPFSQVRPVNACSMRTPPRSDVNQLSTRRWPSRIRSGDLNLTRSALLGPSASRAESFEDRGGSSLGPGRLPTRDAAHSTALIVSENAKKLESRDPLSRGTQGEDTTPLLSSVGQPHKRGPVDGHRTQGSFAWDLTRSGRGIFPGRVALARKASLGDAGERQGPFPAGHLGRV
jgi:hypothetical protein